MTKLVSLVAVLTMVAHFIRPFGLPGLRRRSDIWKLALAAFFVVILVAVVRPN